MILSPLGRFTTAKATVPRLASGCHRRLCGSVPKYRRWDPLRGTHNPRCFWQSVRNAERHPARLAPRYGIRSLRKNRLPSLPDISGLSRTICGQNCKIKTSTCLTIRQIEIYKRWSHLYCVIAVKWVIFRIVYDKICRMDTSWTPIRFIILHCLIMRFRPPLQSECLHRVLITPFRVYKINVLRQSVQ